jgi:hypothetical protein
LEPHCALFDLVKRAATEREQLQHQSSFSKRRRGRTTSISAQPAYFLHPASKPAILGCASRPYSPYGAPSKRVARPGLYRAVQAVRRTNSQAVRVWVREKAVKFVEGRGFASDKFLSCRCKISEFALFPEIIKITKQKTGFPSWVFPGSFDQK